MLASCYPYGWLIHMLNLINTEMHQATNTSAINQTIARLHYQLITTTCCRKHSMFDCHLLITGPDTDIKLLNWSGPVFVYRSNAKNYGITN